MPETFIFIPGRTSRQGTTLNEGKFSDGFVEETATLLMCPDDMTRLGLAGGDRVRLRSAQGQVELPCQPAREHLARIPYVALDPKETATVRAAAVAFTTATYGINVAGTVYRMDDVPIPPRPAFESPYPSDEQVLRSIERRIREIQAQNAR
jgi:formylmethanofuran dehydrogenase subunit D